MLWKHLNSVIQILEEVYKYLLFFYFFSVRCNINVKCIKAQTLRVYRSLNFFINICTHTTTNLSKYPEIALCAFPCPFLTPEATTELMPVTPDELCLLLNFIEMKSYSRSSVHLASLALYGCESLP